MAFRNDDKFIPKYIPNDLKWYEKDGLETWYLKNKSNDFLTNPDEYFEKMNIVNFDIIKGNVSGEKMKQFNSIDHQEIMRYPREMREEIFSSIYRNGNRKDMHVKKETLHEHFKNTNKTSSRIGRGKSIKKNRDDMYKQSW